MWTDNGNRMVTLIIFNYDMILFNSRAFNYIEGI